MNVRKNIDYSAMFAALDALIDANLPQMELYHEIGRLISIRQEKGAAIAAAEHLQNTFPEASGFSPRNLRRMREFYHVYADAPELMSEAMSLGWTQNIVILEADLEMRERLWYIREAVRCGWSKSVLVQRIAVSAHLCLDLMEEMCYAEENNFSRDDTDLAEITVSQYNRNANAADGFLRIVAYQLLYKECSKFVAPQWFHCGIFICGGKAMNAFEKSESIKASLRQGFQDGSSKMAKRKCYGYTIGSDGQLVINSDEAQIVRWIFERYLVGDSLGEIASGLEQQGIPSPTGRAKWNREAIDKLLSNEKYTGRVLLQKTISTGVSQIENDGRMARYLYTGSHEAIISDEMFMAAQEEKLTRAKEPEKAVAIRLNFL